MAEWYNAIEKRWDGDDSYIKEEWVDGELRQTWATVIDDHNVCVVRFNENNNDVIVWVDNAARNTSLDKIDSFIQGRLSDY